MTQFNTNKMAYTARQVFLPREGRRVQVFEYWCRNRVLCYDAVPEGDDYNFMRLCGYKDYRYVGDGTLKTYLGDVADGVHDFLQEMVIVEWDRVREPPPNPFTAGYYIRNFVWGVQEFIRFYYWKFRLSINNHGDK